MAPARAFAAASVVLVAVLAAFCVSNATATVAAYSAVNRFLTNTTCAGVPDAVTYTWTNNCTTATCATTWPAGKTTRTCSATVAFPANATYVLVAKSFNVSASTCGGYAASNVVLRINTCVPITNTTSHIVRGDAKGLEYSQCGTVNCENCTTIYAPSDYCFNSTKLTYHYGSVTSAGGRLVASRALVAAVMAAIFTVLWWALL